MRAARDAAGRYRCPDGLDRSRIGLTTPGENYAFCEGVRAFAGVPMTELAAEFGTPLYVYDAAQTRAAWRAYAQAFGGRAHRICYAVKANHNPHLLAALVELGSGFDIVSGGELALVLDAGADPGEIVFSGVGKTRAELIAALDAGIGCFNVESAAELELLDELAAARGLRAPVALRVNPDVDPKTHPYIATGLSENKFGIAMDEARDLYRRAARMPGLETVGVACHIGSQLTDITPMVDAAALLAELVGALTSDGIGLEHVDLGGGLGVDYEGEAPPAPAELVAKVAPLFDEALTLCVEPGRSIVAAAGTLITEVLFTKTNGDRKFVVVDAAMNDLMRPSLYGARHRIHNVRAETAPRRCDVVGPVCETGDFLGRDVVLDATAGDLLAVADVGAYGYVMASNYNVRGRPAEVWVDEGRAVLSRRRETLADMRRLDQEPHG